MTKSTGVGRGGYRKGARRPKLDEKLKRVKYIVSLQAGQIADFEAATGGTKAAKRQIEEWVRAYTIARGETDRLLAQSLLAAELFSYLEATDAPKDLCDRLESLIVQRASNEMKIAEGVAQVGESFIII